MEDLALKVDNISKVYNLGQATSKTLIEAFNIINLFKKKDKREVKEYWALKDVSFQVPKGEAVGIIGKNGAGKSTLLKILSKITEPTNGRIEIDGRISSLLEVGTGFHADLSGRENIYLNGTILGMKRSEINAKFKEIIEFSEIEKFIDTPVKRYSSGMYVRLAFAVAAHLEPEILIIDEVLAVGDSVFQKKCIDKMTDVCKQGRTVLFVSHNFATVKALCSNAVLLEKGKFVFQGSVEDTLNLYANETKQTGQEIDLSKISRKGYANELIFDKVIFENSPIPFGEPIKMKIKLKTQSVNKKFTDLDFGLNILDKNQSHLIHCSNRFINTQFNHDNDNYWYTIEIENNLKPGVYYMNFFLRAKDIIQDFLIGEVSILVEEGNPYGFINTLQIQGAILPRFNMKKEAFV